MPTSSPFAETESAILSSSDFTCVAISLFGRCFGFFRHCWTANQTGSRWNFPWTSTRNSVLPKRNFCSRPIGWTTFDLTKNFFSFYR